jgi:mannitol/fructose-specific phosphotransferase system IIA component (Ntr-type)
MHLRSSLSQESIALHLKGATKEAIITELLDILVKTGKVKDPDRAFASIMDREHKMSTGMKHGIAIPHGKTDAVEELVACIGVSDAEIPFDALDGKPCRIFIMTLSPAERTGPHLQFLAEVSLLFKSQEKRTALLSAASPDDVLKILSD